MHFALSLLSFLLLGSGIHAGLLPLWSTHSTPLPCSCTSGLIPVPVDTHVASDYANAPLTLDRRLQTTWNIYGVYCEPASHTPNSVQLLLHGSTYTSRYWTFDINDYQNYSYVDHACAQGQATFAYDAPGVGRSDHPANSTDVQLPSAAAVAIALGNGLKSGSVTNTLKVGFRLFEKVIAMGHSQGSLLFCYSAVTWGDSLPFYGLILTGHIHDEVYYTLNLHGKVAAAQENLGRWGTLDAGYVTTAAGTRNVFYPPDAWMFDPAVLALDEATKDISTSWYVRNSSYVPAPRWTGPVVELIGSKDQQHCTDATGVVVECVQATLQVSEKHFWPNSRNLTVVVRPGGGHDVNMDFMAAGSFDIITGIVNSWTSGF